MDTLTRSHAVLRDNLEGFYRGKCVVVTGAAGSVGGAVAEELATLGCERLVLLDQFDHGLLDILERVERIDRRLDVVDVLCDIRDRTRLIRWFARVRPDVIIHAAALKHVHLGERHPGSCVITNLVGVRNALCAAHEAGAKDFALISSDKAASPACVMGATKRLAELHLLGFEREHGATMMLKAVRFGNIVGSQGSVLPRFSAQIAAGGPLEVTHPDMERFFMTVEESVGLILSVTRGNDGPGTYFMEMGQPVSILELGREMVERSGRKIRIEFTGLRPGEKLREELFDDFESVSSASLPGVFKVSPRTADAALSTAEVDELERAARTLEDVVLRQRVFAYLDAKLQREERRAG